MAQMVVVKSKNGHVFEMNKLSFDRIWGPKGRQGGYELATEEDIKGGMTPLVLNLPPGVEKLSDLDEDQAKAHAASLDVSTATAPTAGAAELTKQLQNADEPTEVTTGDPAPGTAQTTATARTRSGSGSPASTDTGNSSQQSS